MTNVSFDDRVVLVTGAGHGLGRAYALEFARRGAKVIVNDIGRLGTGGPFSADQVVEEIEGSGGAAIASHHSIIEASTATELVALAVASYGRLDVVVNNAGIVQSSSIEEMPLDLLDSMLAVHLRGAVLVTQKAFLQMREQRYGRIISMTSSAAIFGLRGQLSYAVAKAGLIGMTKIVSLEGSEHGVFVNAVMPNAATNPGRTKTDIQLEDAGALIDRVSTGYITPLVVYLASDQCLQTGQIYSALGGRFARAFIGVTTGWMAPRGPAPTAEDIAAHWGEVENAESYSEPLSLAAEFNLVAKRARTELC